MQHENKSFKNKDITYTSKSNTNNKYANEKIYKMRKQRKKYINRQVTEKLVT